MRSLVILFSAYFWLHLTYFFVKDSINKKEYIIQYTMLSLEASMVLLGGILSTFVVHARSLFLFSIASFAVGFSFYLNPGPFFINMGIIWVAFAYGLFKFLFIVIILDQKPEGCLKFKLGMWTITQNAAELCYVTASKYLSFAVLVIPSYFVSGIVIYGVLSETITIESKLINIVIFIRKLSQSERALTGEDKDIIVSISKSVIIWFLLIAYALCDSQILYSYEHQSRCLEHLGENNTIKKYWPSVVDCTSTIIIMAVILVAYHKNVFGLERLYKNMQLKVILGNILMIVAVFFCAALETIRLNSDTSTEAEKILMTESPTTKISRLSVLWMIPYIILGIISEILAVLTCYEYIYLHSTEYTKFMSNAFISSLICTGCIPDVVFMVVNSNYLDLEACIPKKRTPSIWNLSKYEYLIYSLGALATVSLFVSIFMMKRFQVYFSTTKHYQNLAESGNLP